MSADRQRMSAVTERGGSVEILGCRVDRLSMSSAIERMERLIESGGKHQAIVLPATSVMRARRDQRFLDVCNAASLVLPDGVPLLWASRLLAAPIPGRVAGPDLLWELSRVAAERGYTCFLLGSTQTVLTRLQAVLLQRFPRLRVAGSFAPPVSREMSAAVNDDIVRRVNTARPDILWVAMGAPRQELWIHSHLDRLDARVAIGVGGAFDMCSGLSRRAPPWMQRAGLEWFHRFLLEPGRLFRRYFIETAPFLPLVLWQSARRSSGVRPTAVRRDRAW